jgi:hypothetical protein
LLGQLMEMLAHQFRVVQIEGTGVRLFLGHADFRQVIDQNFCLNLEFPS